MALSPEDRVLAHRRRERLQRRAAAWEKSLPKNLQGHSLDDLLESSCSQHISPASVVTVRKWMDNPTPFLILHGASGLGKTLISMLIVGRMIERGKAETALYIPSTKLLDGLSDYSDRADGGMIARAKKPEILLLDDIGSGGMELSPARRTGLWDIIDYRWSHNKPTIVTTNLAVSESSHSKSDSAFTVEDYVGKSAWDRMTDRQTDIAFIGETHRKKQDDSVEARRRARAARRNLQQ